MSHGLTYLCGWIDYQLLDCSGGEANGYEKQELYCAIACKIGCGLVSELVLPASISGRLSEARLPEKKCNAWIGTTRAARPLCSASAFRQLVSSWFKATRCYKTYLPLWSGRKAMLQRV